MKKIEELENYLKLITKLENCPHRRSLNGTCIVCGASKQAYIEVKTDPGNILTDIMKLLMHRNDISDDDFIINALLLGHKVSVKGMDTVLSYKTVSSGTTYNEYKCKIYPAYVDSKEGGGTC